MAALILASGSPRRAELLAQAGMVFEVRAADIPEEALPGEVAEAFALRMAEDKARAVAHPGEEVIAADTIVVVDGKILGKPQDEDEAARMLESLSGRIHRVMTGVAVQHADGEMHSWVTQTEVEFKSLSAEEISRYVASGDPMDKAGSYGIQSGAAYMVRAIRGSYTNVVGLPMAEVLDATSRRKR